MKGLQTENRGYSKSNLITAVGDGSPHVHTQADSVDLSQVLNFKISPCSVFCMLSFG